MKTKILYFVILFIITKGLFSQRFAYVDSKYILKNMPEYKEAKAEMNELSEQWQKTIDEKYKEIDKLIRTYEVEEILLSESLKQERRKQIEQKQSKALEYQKRKFGVDGDLFIKRQEIIKPLQDLIYEAIKELAEERNYAAIFDKANNKNILYSNPKYDKTETILRKLGISVKKVKKSKK